MTEGADTTGATDPVPLPELTAESLAGFKAIGFFTADHAVVEGGKVYANGAYWQALTFPAFPAALPVAAVVAVIEVPWHANNSDHRFSVELMDSDGQRLPSFEINGQFRGAPSAQMQYGEPGIMPIAIPLFGLQFEHPGDYSFVLKVDEQELARYTVNVRQVVSAGGMRVGQPPAPPPSAW